MKIGKISESVLKRTIIKEIKYKNKAVKCGSAIGNDASVIAGMGKDFASSIATYSGDIMLSAKRAFCSAINSLAAKGASAAAINVSILMPETTKESQLRNVMVWLCDEGERYGVQIAGGHTETSAVVQVPVVTISGLGYIESDRGSERQNVRPGMDIVMVGYAGLEGTAVMAIEKENELRERFTPGYISKAKVYADELTVAKEAAVAVQHGATAMHDTSKGGVFGALWEIGERLKMGVNVNLKSIPIRQETVEFCEYFDYNPYFICSSGALLVVTDNGEMMADAFRESGKTASVIGKMTEGHDKAIVNGEEKRFLEPPKSGKKEYII